MLNINEPVAPKAPPAPFTVTEAAASRITRLLADEPPGTAFWIAVLGGGCSGFQYHFELAAKVPGAGDLVIGNVVVDEVALDMLKGSTLDYIEDLASAGFEIKNPNATAKCGCGNSFSVPF